MWIGDALSNLGLSVYGRAYMWRLKRQAGPSLEVKAAVEMAALLFALLLAGRVM